ncbi:response regulator transcription factor [Novosphingobium sp.]|uniref:response regulator transcription factor n=1 Tax=Novosphingobium sp. TaxID=1874826 RepID=UPI00273622DB|nr:response regulator transcription factor [Novosphingobium sp.]MDP3907312.1 response regulator transcription factor [Novosphingobium sp.]
MSRILCIDDEPAILRLLAVVLEVDGHEAIAATNGREALAIVAHDDIAAVLLDLGLPDRDGLELIPALRALRTVPILVISARTDISEKVTALDLGASDYITKPFDGEEVRARLRSALRLSAGTHLSGGELHCGTIRMNPDRHEAEVAGRQLSLTPKEYSVLLALVEAGGRVLTHAALLERVWGKAHKADVEYLRVAVRALRLKIEDDPSRPAIIRNEPGVGYRLS